MIGLNALHYRTFSPIHYRKGGECMKCLKYITTGNSSFRPVTIGHVRLVLHYNDMQSISGLTTRRRILLTGTPIQVGQEHCVAVPIVSLSFNFSQNDLHEFYSLVDLCNPGILGKFDDTLPICGIFLRDGVLLVVFRLTGCFSKSV